MCRGKQNSQENHYNWQGGLTKLQEQIRKSILYKNWRKFCTKRDDYTCQICGQRSGAHHVDHVKPFAVILDENNIKTFEEALNCKELWDINNGRTLCIDCHKQTLSYLNPNIITQYYAIPTRP